MVTLNTISTEILKYTTARNERLQKVSMQNNDVMPTVDNLGRFHAPFDGYLWLDDVLYLGGQYLPFDDDAKSNNNVRLLISVSLVEQLSMILDGYALCDTGKQWLVNDIPTTYCYISGTKGIINILKKYSPDRKKIVLATDETTSKVWEYKQGTINRRMAQVYGYNWVEHALSIMDECYFGVPYTLELVKGKLTLLSSFTGKLVCYDYPTPITE